MEIFSIFYHPEFNVFQDQDGDIVFDIFSIISPNRLLLMKKNGGTFYTTHPICKDVICEIVFPIKCYDYEERKD